MARLLLTAGLTLCIGCADAGVSSDCTPAGHCHLVDGVPTCDVGTVWEDPADNDNLRCVAAASCEPEADAALCVRLGKNCGLLTAPDNCGAMRTGECGECGECSGNETCGGSGIANVCGTGACVPETDAALCARLSRACGPASGGDNCGAARTVVSCGACAGFANPVCTTDGQCIEEVCAPDCQGLQCGPDGCGGTCGQCQASEICGAISPGQCDVPVEHDPPLVIDIYEGDLGEHSSMAIDAAGTIHVAYTNPGYGIKYGRLSGGIWRLTLVDPTVGEALQPRIAVDADGHPTIAYFDNDVQDLRVARWSPTGWINEVVDSSGHVGKNPSLALDAAGRPHVSYWDQSNYNVKYTTWDGAWQSEPLASFSSTMQRSAIAIDAAGDVWVASTIGDTVLAKKTAGGWDLTTLTGVVIFPHVFLFDVTGSGHIVGRPGVTGIRYATNQGGTWLAETVEVDTYGQPAMFLDGSGTPHLTYTKNAANGLVYATRLAGGWNTEDVDPTATSRVMAGLVVDAASAVHISFHGYENFGATNDPLKLARKGASGWQVSHLDRSGSVGQHSSLVFDQYNRPHVAYYGSANSDLRYAVWDGAYWWTEIVDGLTTRAGTFASLQLDAGGNPHIAYHDETLGELRYAVWTGTQWDLETVDDQYTDIGEEVSLQLDSSGTPHISYLDAASYDLRYARWSGSDWSLEVVDSFGTCGEGSAMALDSQGYPHISYMYGQTDDLRYATWTGSDWLVETVDEAATVVGETAIAIDGAGAPCISYHDVVGDELLLTCRNTAGTWSTEIVDGQATAGRSELSMRIDATGTRHLAYWYSGDGTVTYAHDANGTWVHQPLDYDQEIGGYPSLALDDAGHAFITAYKKNGYYMTNGALIMVRF